MKLLIVQEPDDKMSDVLTFIGAVKKLRKGAKVYLFTDSKHHWELNWELKIDGIIQKPCSAEDILDKL